jgi:hypothetical protein
MPIRGEGGALVAAVAAAIGAAGVISASLAGGASFVAGARGPTEVEVATGADTDDDDDDDAGPVNADASGSGCDACSIMVEGSCIGDLTTGRTERTQRRPKGPTATRVYHIMHTHGEHNVESVIQNEGSQVLTLYKKFQSQVKDISFSG